MSGWDVSPTHTWGQQEGPDETQNFGAPGASSRDFGDDFGSQEFGRRAPGSPPGGFPQAAGGFPGERSSANPPPEFFGQGYGQQDPPGSSGYPQRTPGRSLHDMPQRDMRPGAHDAGYGQDGAYGDNGYGQDGGFGHDGGFGQEAGFGQDAGFNQDWGAGDQGDGWSTGNTGGRPGARWDDRGQRDGGYQDLDGGFGRQDPGRLGYAGQDYGSQDYPAQDYPAQDYGSQDYPGQQGRGTQASPSYGRREQDSAARSDPALQDFFSPQSGYAPSPGGGPGFPREPQYRQQDDDGWGGWDGPASPQPPRTGTGPRPVSRAARGGGGGGGGGGGERRGLSMTGIIVIGVVVAVIIVVAYVVLSKGSGKTPTAANSPSGGAPTSAAAKPSASKPAAAAAAYKLSTPTTAGGYPQGQDPHFLATATATAEQIVTAVKSGGGGTVQGNPVSAAYTLPASQVMTFVGYQGTFTPAKVATILATLGSDPHTYPAGPNGGMLGCANTPATATATSGAVCVWATTSTLGITEFFNATGPEALVQSQSKGAADAVKLRADVEAKA
jgi:hypothetical protein